MSTISLQHCAVVVDQNEPSFVHHAIGELRRQIESLTGDAPRLFHDSAAAKGMGIVILVGRAAAEQALGRNYLDLDTCSESFVVESTAAPGYTAIVVAGADAMGTSYAVMHLDRLLATSGSASLPGPLRVNEKPRYRWRGLYLHQHWRYKHPYATWSWSVEDWKKAIDLCAHMRFNLVMIWPHADMMAPPLSVVEKDLLADLRVVIDYAQRKRGIKIWLVEPANVVLDQPEVRRMSVEERDYYAYAHMKGGGLKNPANPQDRAVMRANREALYENVPNADGYGYIDSDPGGWIGSTASEFADLLAANRELLDRHHERPREATLFHWVLAGWGHGTAEETWRDTMTDVTQRVSEPRGFLACFAHHVEIAKQLEHLPQTLFFPYGIIEGEPSFPLTGLLFDQLGRAFEFADKYPGLGGVIGNVQTFLMQLPNIYFTARRCWDASAAENVPEFLRELAEQLLPDQAELLVGAWRELEWAGMDWAHHDSGRARKVAAIVRQLEKAVQAVPHPRLGSLGRFVFPRASILLEDLAMMMRVHAAGLAVREMKGASATVAKTKRAAGAYLRAMLEWQERNGFFGAYGVNKEVIYDQYLYNPDAQAAQAAIQERMNPEERKAVEAGLFEELIAAGYAPGPTESMVQKLFKTRKPVSAAYIEAEIFSKLPPASETQPWTQPPPAGASKRTRKAKK